MSNDEDEMTQLNLENIRAPYDENKVVGFVTGLYELLIKLAYLDRGQITWPPDTGHAINEDLCRRLQLEPEIVLLMKRLPLRRDYILPWDIPLTAPGDEGPHLVLDIREDTVREIPWDEDPEDSNPEGWELEGPDDLRYYRNYYPQHAPYFFRRFLEKIETLEVIPSNCEQFERQYYGAEQPDVRNSARQTLIETYGWPGNFRQEDRKRDAEGVWGGIIRQSLD